MTVIGPYALFMLRNSGRVIVWSPPSVIKRGKVLPFLETPTSFAFVAGSRISSALWPSSIWWIAQALSYLKTGQYRSTQRTKLKTYDVTGISPQSITLAQSLNGLAARGTL